MTSRSIWLKRLKPLADPVITLSIWAYFTLGYILLFSPFYIASFLISKDREKSYQRLNNIFYIGFFKLMTFISPGLSFDISDDVRNIRSSVIVCNHVSYLDPILLISLFEKQKTIIRGSFFSVPIFGSVLKISGYIPSYTEGKLGLIMIKQITRMEEYLASGGNLFIFPEGTRSRDGKIGRFDKGAFKIAKQCGAPIRVLMIRNTNRFFRPGKFLFNTCVPITIKIRKIADITPDYQSRGGIFSAPINGLMAQVHRLMRVNVEE